MKTISTRILNGLLIGCFFAACGEPNSKSSKFSDVAVTETKQSIKTNEKIVADSIASLKQDSLIKIKKADQEEKLNTAIRFAEKDFFSSLKGVDRDFSENNFSAFSKILKQHKRTVFDLYLELVEIKKKAYSKAKTCCTETRANGSERILNNYYDVLKQELADGENKFQAKYGFDNRLMLCFENNYCSCLGDNSDKYCLSGQAILPNAEYWKK